MLLYHSIKRPVKAFVESHDTNGTILLQSKSCKNQSLVYLCSFIINELFSNKCLSLQPLYSLSAAYFRASVDTIMDREVMIVMVLFAITVILCFANNYLMLD